MNDSQSASYHPLVALAPAPVSPGRQVAVAAAAGGQPTEPGPGRPTAGRPVVRGKFIQVGDEKLYVRGVTYGTFQPDAEGNQFPTREMVGRDFALMEESGVNAVRTYTVPPRWLLDLAQEHGLFVMVGMPWEQHITFLSDRSRVRSIKERIREGVRACAGHPAVLCYSIGNEIPAPIVRWYGRRAVENFLEELYHVAKAEDPEGLVSYVNYPSTEYLTLPFVDIFCFNVYLEAKPKLEAYLARLQTLAGNRPLLMAEIGLDSRRNGFGKQADVLDWQVRTAFAAGCCGAFLFAWTDEWYRGGLDIDDWDFGLVTRDRKPKPALEAVRNAFNEVPFAAVGTVPRISVVVCTYNGGRTLRGCLRSVMALAYPEFEVIVVDDGSRDDSAAIAREFPVRLISTNNQGLSAARNVGMGAATGEILAYIDDDAYPDPHWLQYLSATFQSTAHAAVGGPNLPPAGDGAIAECVANAPGGPVHVLLSDTEAEHIPGCNFAVRKDRLKAIGGFDPQFSAAGDDVDVCWRIQQQGWTIGFSPAAVVWHHRRNSVLAYWKQQQGYGKAEALLERKWPEKYNAVGHIKWAGRLYGAGLTRMLLRRQRVYHGTWGAAPFQSLHESEPSLLTVLPTMPEWYLVVVGLAGLSTLALSWSKLMFALPVLVLVGAATVWQAAISAREASFPGAPHSRATRVKLVLLTGCLHLLQPLARLLGRARHGLTLLRCRVPLAFILPVPKHSTVWSEKWLPSEQALQTVTDSLRADGAAVVTGGDHDRWDVEVRGGALCSARLLMTVEEHGTGKQMFRFRVWPKFSGEGIVALVASAVLTTGAALDQCWLASALLLQLTLLLGVRALFESACAMAAIQRVLGRGIKKGQ